MELQHQEITDKIINAFYKVYNTLGSGFLEKIYENSLFFELMKMGLKVEQQKPINVYYLTHPVGVYYADLVVNSCVIVETKAAEQVNPAHEAQLFNYLKATEIEVGILLNFGGKPEFRRKFLSKERKNSKSKEGAK